MSDPPTKFESCYQEARNAPPGLRAAGSTTPPTLYPVPAHVMKSQVNRFSAECTIGCLGHEDETRRFRHHCDLPEQIFPTSIRKIVIAEEDSNVLVHQHIKRIAVRLHTCYGSGAPCQGRYRNVDDTALRTDN